MRFAFVLVLVPLTAACASAASRSAAYPPSQVAEAAVLPPGFQSGERLRADCVRTVLRDSSAEAALADIDCSFERLTRTLKARAGELASSLIVEKQCRSSSRGRKLACSATVARAGSSVPFAAREALSEVGPAPAPAQVQDLDEPRPQDAAEIRVGFLPASPRNNQLVPRAYDAVAETQLPSVGREPLGQLSASCEHCSTDALHHALRVSAGRLGAGEISGVRCFQDDGRLVCVASALVPWSS